MNAVKPPDPFGRLLNIFPRNAFDGGFGSNAPSVVRFVIDDHDILGRRHILKDFPSVGFVAEGSAFIHGLTLRNSLLGFPVELMPVSYFDFALTECIFEARRNEAEFAVIIFWAGNEYLQ